MAGKSGSGSKILRYVAARFGFEIEDGKLRTVKTQVDETTRRIQIMGREMRRASMQFRAAASNIVDSLKWVAASQIGLVLTTQWASQTDAMAKLAKGAGITAQEMQGLAYVAERGGVQAEQLGIAIAKMARRLMEASQDKAGTGESAKFFKQLGISIKNSAGQVKGGLDVFYELADKIQQMGPGTKTTYFAFKAFEETGPKFVDTLLGGSGAIKDLMYEAQRLGVVQSQKATEAATALVDQQTRVKAAILGVRNVIAASLAPALIDIATRFTEWIQITENKTKLLAGLRIAAKIAGVVIGTIVTAKVLAGLTALKAALYSAGRALIAMGTSGAAAHVMTGGLFLALGALAVALYKLHQQFSTGKKNSIAEAILGGLSKEEQASLKETVMMLGQMARGFVILMSKLAANIVPALAKAFVAIVIQVGRLFGAAAAIVQNTWAWLIKLKTDFVDAVQAIRDWFWNLSKEIERFINGISSSISALFMSALKPIVEWWDRQVAKVKSAIETVRGAFNSFNATEDLEALDITKLPGQAGTQDNSVSVGQVSVTVQGSTGMGPQEISAAVETGVNKVFSQRLRRARAAFTTLPVSEAG